MPPGSLSTLAVMKPGPKTARETDEPRSDEGEWRSSAYGGLSHGKVNFTPDRLPRTFQNNKFEILVVCQTGGRRSRPCAPVEYPVRPALVLCELPMVLEGAPH